MDNNLNNDYINNAVEELVDFLGIRDSVSAEKVRIPYSRGETKECIKDIANCLGLPITINLSYVSKNYTPNDSNSFHSQHLVKTDYRGRGTEGIVAQVLIPGNLPMYGTPSFNGLPIDVRVSENCIEYPRVFMAIMAHELSHIVLHSLFHKNKDNEFYTDLTAMVLGFSDILKYGRKITKVERGFDTTTTHTTTYGYLSDEQFDFAFNKINKLLNKYKRLKKEILRKTENLEANILSCQKTILKFTKYIENIDKHYNKNFTKEDGQRIMLMHQIEFADQFHMMMRECKNKLESFNKIVKETTFYSDNYFNTIKQSEEELKTLFQKLNNKFAFLNEDIGILKKYTSLFDKIIIFFSIM